MAEIKKYKNGATLIVNSDNNVQSVSVCIGVKCGAINEDETNFGISHLIEHLTFKGTKKRTNEEISKSFENVGALSNAFTTLLATTYYVQTLKENLKTSFEILSDCFLNSTYADNLIKKERKVVYAEAKQDEDDCNNYCYEKLLEKVYKNEYESYKVLGSKKTLKNITHDMILNYKNKFYIPSNFIFSFSGNITLKEAKDLINEYFNYGEFDEELKTNTDNKLYFDLNINNSRFNPSKVYIKKDSAQAYIHICFPTFDMYNKANYALDVFSVLWGKEMSSRLFSSLREKYGYVYEISSANDSFYDSGDIDIGFSTSEENLIKSLNVIKKEINLVTKNITLEEVDRSKQIIKSIIAFEYEDIGKLAINNAISYCLFNKITPLKEILAKYNSVTLSDVQTLAKNIYTNKNYGISIISRNRNKKAFNILNN